MKKLMAVIAVTATLATPAFAQYTYNPATGEYLQSPRTNMTEVYVQGSAPRALYTQRGVMTDPDPFIAGSILRNYNFYQNLNN